jgi:hypothetical protein
VATQGNKLALYGKSASDVPKACRISLFQRHLISGASLGEWY